MTGIRTPAHAEHRADGRRHRAGAFCAVLWAVALAARPAAAQCRSFSAGKWRADIDAASGAIVRLEWDGHEVSANPGGRPTVGLAAPERAEAPAAASEADASGEAHGMTASAVSAPAKELPLALSGVSFDEAAGKLVLSFESGRGASSSDSSSARRGVRTGCRAKRGFRTPVRPR